MCGFVEVGCVVWLSLPFRDLIRWHHDLLLGCGVGLAWFSIAVSMLLFHHAVRCVCQDVQVGFLVRREERPDRCG